MFELINIRQGLIEIQSEYHFWCLMQVEDTDKYFVFHKYRKHQQYHRQVNYPLKFHQAKQLILNHDKYVSETLADQMQQSVSPAASIP